MIIDFNKINETINNQNKTNYKVIAEISEDTVLNEKVVGRDNSDKGIKIVVTNERQAGDSKSGQGDIYFKVCDKNIQDVDHCPCARISIYKPVYVVHGQHSLKLSSDQRDMLVKYFSSELNTWRNLLEEINKFIFYNKRVPLDLPIPDYNKLEVSSKGVTIT